mmetsp:Transcript_95708/g.257008  ORF Transcript_95708/g.257008 Transcript_95708/m.257008 type:complete len:143 (-) Transcript_95708:255-683(-)
MSVQSVGWLKPVSARKTYPCTPHTLYTLSDTTLHDLIRSSHTNTMTSAVDMLATIEQCQAPARHVISLADLLDGNSATDGGKKDEDKPARPVFIPPPPGLRTSLSSKAPAFVPIRKDQAADTFEKAAQASEGEGTDTSGSLP